MLDALRKLNIFKRLRVLEEREKERDESLELILVNLQAVEGYLDRRIKAVDEQNAKLNVLPVIDLDLASNLDVM